MKRIAALLIFFGGCKCGKKPEPPPLEHVTDLIVEDAAAPDTGPPHATRAWIRFHGPAFQTETPLHGGPDWSFETDLPAIDAAGNIALAHDATNDLSDVPNLAIRTIGPDLHMLSTNWVLEVPEFEKALAATSKKSAFASLGTIVEARVAAANTDLDAKRYTPLTTCEVVDAPYAEHPPCSMATQAIRCGATNVVYSKQTLTIGTVKKAFPKWKAPPMKTAYGPMEIGECFLSAFIDEARKVFVGELVYMCQGGGDWCTVDPEWRIVTW